MVRSANPGPELDASVRWQRLSGGEDVDTFPESARGVDPPGDDQRVEDGSGVFRWKRSHDAADEDGRKDGQKQHSR